MTLTPQDLPRMLQVPLSAEQLAAATAPLEPQLIVAGAGTGKTTVMAARVTWLVATGQVRSEEVLGLTFTNKATGELRGRIRSALSRIPADRGPVPDAAGQRADATVLTYHSFAGQLLSEFGPLLGVDPGSAPLTDGLRARLAHRVACAPAVSPERLVDIAASSPTSLSSKILALDDALADLGVSTTELVEFDRDLRALIARDDGAAKLIGEIDGAAAGRLVLADLVDQFRALKKSEGLQDFSDQVRLGCDLSADDHWVAPMLRSRYRVVLLDEYQDTSRAQRLTMQRLFGDGHPVTAVGDPCQAIYGWRGASSTNIDGFPDHFRTVSGGQATSYPLTVNRRSDVAVIDAANRIAAELQGVHEQIAPLQAAPDSDLGTLTVALLETHDDEVLWVCDQVVRAAERRDPQDIAVLCRKNDQLSEMAQALVDRGVPVQISAKQALFTMPQVREVVDMLRLVDGTDANASMVNILMGPHFRVGPGDLALLRRRARYLAEASTRAVVGSESSDFVQSDAEGSADPALSSEVGEVGEPSDAHAEQPRVERLPEEPRLLDALFDLGGLAYSAEARERFGQLADLINHLLGLRARSAPEVIERTLELLGLPALWEDGPFGAADRAAMTAFVGFARDFEGLEGGRALAELLAYVDDCERFGTQPNVELPTSEGRVTLMTVHGSKGLEFPVVVLPFLSDGVFPSALGRSRWPKSSSVVPQVIAGEPDAAEQVGFPDEGVTTKSFNAYVAAAQAAEALDEDRLAYVAVTRAEHEVIASGHWWGPTQRRPRGPSAYLSAIRRTCELGAGEVAMWTPPPTDGAESPVLSTPANSILWPNPTLSADASRIAADLDDVDPPNGVGPVDPPKAVVDVAPTNGVRDADPAPTPLDPDLDPSRWVERVDAVLAHLKGSPNPAHMPETLSVSETIAWRADPKAFQDRLLRPMPRGPSEAAAAGTAFHDWVERRLGQQELFIPDVSGGFVDPSDLEALVSGDFSPILIEMFAKTEFADRTPAAVEHPFTIHVNGLTITGKIDAVFMAPDPGGRLREGREWTEQTRYQVVDWKTGATGRSDPNQLALYRYAWAEYASVPIEHVDAAFVYVASGEVHWYRDLPEPAELLS